MANESGIDSDLIRGHIDTIILKSLFESDKYGYEICKEVEERSGGTYELKQPTLYSCLKRLENQKLISSYWTDSEIGGKRHYYKLTDLGKETYQKNQDDWNRSRVIIDSLISNGEAPKFIIESNQEEVDSLQKQVEELKTMLEENKNQQENQEQSELKNQEIDNLQKQVEELKTMLEENKNQQENQEQSELKNQEIDNLQKQVEELKTMLEEEKQNKPIEKKIVYVPVQDVQFTEQEPFSPVEIETDKTDSFIPWATQEELNSEQEQSFAESIEEREKLLGKEVLNEDEIASSVIVDPETELENSELEPVIMQEGDQSVKYVQLSDNFIARVASNGEILSVEKAPQKSEQSEEELFNANVDETPAQASVFETAEDTLVFNDEPVDVSDQQDAEDDVDIMALLGHTSPASLEHTEKKLIESEEQILLSKQEMPQLEAPKNQPEYEESSAPFVFNIEDEFSTSDSFLESANKKEDVYYNAPIEKIEGKDNTSTFDFDKFKAEHVDHNLESKYSQISELSDDMNNSPSEESSPSPDYYNFNSEQPEKDDGLKNNDIYNPDAIYQNPDKVEEHTYSLFDEEDLLENNDDYDRTVSWENYESATDSEIETIGDDMQFQQTEELETAEKQMPFYQTTENYDNMETTYTDEKYKEKLNSLMSYQSTDGVRQNYKMLKAPKDFRDLKADFEEEGIIVKPHTKMVKESKSTRSYVEANKLNLINSWTAYGFVVFLATLTFLVMNNYKSSFSTFDFSAKYFLIGLGILMIIPLIYSVFYFINPYKKKPARYAYRIYILFAFLLTIQLLIIIYSVNLQLGFYSVHQENYNHLYWIVPTILSTYPMFDAIMHGVYFNSRNFHI